MTFKHLLSAVAVLSFSGMALTPAQSADSKNTRASFAPPGDATNISIPQSSDPDVLVFTSPPRETVEEGQRIYAPIAAYLSKAIGKTIIYRHPGTWGAYRSEMLKGSYDLIFDGPHFNSYRAEKLNHNILVKLPGRHEFVVIVRKDEKYATVSQMGGRRFCSHAPPNLGALVLLSQFDNPARQPYIVPTDGWDKIYEGVVSGQCSGGILPLANLQKLDKNGAMKVIHKTAPMPNQAFSAGPRLSIEEQAKIAMALTSPNAVGPTEKLRSTFKGEQLISASNTEYNGIAQYLRAEWGYY